MTMNLDATIEDFVKGDTVEILVDNPHGAFLQRGDQGTVMGTTVDGFVAVAFDFPFTDSHDCGGMVKSRNGWFMDFRFLKKLN